MGADMTTTKPTERSAGAIALLGLAALAVIGGLFAMLIIMTAPPATPVPPTADYAGPVRGPFLTEMRATCLKSATDSGASASAAAFYCGCIVDEAAKLSTPEMLRLGVNPEGFDPQINMCVERTRAAAETRAP